LERRVVHPDPHAEYYFDEDSYILESWNCEADPALSIARARVEPGVSTRVHVLDDVIERYLIVEGRGEVLLGEGPAQPVQPGDVVVVPAGTPQSIRNTGETDLVFYALCTPRFTPACYRRLEGG
jgi:mannose-6-phosphate isomerase-like protein (cupin superfamily)